MGARKGSVTTPFLVTLSPFTGMTEVKIVRTADGEVIHCRLHVGSATRALKIANRILDRVTGIDTSAADLPAPTVHREPVSLVKAPAPRVSLRKTAHLRPEPTPDPRRRVSLVKVPH